MKILALIALTLFFAGVAVSPAPAAPQRAQLSDIEDEVMCLVCGTALNLSGSPQADRERAYIRHLIAEGKTKQQIKDALVAQYGERVLAVPPKRGFDLAAWLVPIGAFLLAAAALFTGVRRWRRQARRTPIEPPSVAPENRERLDADLASYDL
jgi:cytochrome c-type biogenesis protein CcmH